MKRTRTININGSLFHFEEEAFQDLQIYLVKLKRHYEGVEGGKEITRDIEARILELLNEKVDVSRQVNRAMVASLIQLMGRPEDIFSEDEAGASGQSKAQQNSSFFEEPPLAKGLYRSRENRMIAGVASGLAFYMGLNPIVIRAIWVGLFIFYGLGFFPYIILWILIPEARTPAQKRAMYGKYYRNKRFM